MTKETKKEKKVRKTKKVKNNDSFFKNLKKEISMVKWPDGKDLVKYTIATVVLCVILVLFFQFLDIKSNGYFIILQIVIPETTEVEIKDGVKKEKVKKMFPGYILVEMIMSDEAWYIVRNTPGVTGFIGSSGKGAKPTPLLPQEIDRILVNMGMSRVNVEDDLKVGDSVSIVDGPFKGMIGKVDSIDTENNRLNIIIDLFGQETSVDVEIFQVSKN